MRRSVVATALISLAACQGQSKQIIADVCKPIDEDKNASFEKLVAEKGYDAEEARTVCHQYVMDQMEDSAKKMRELGIGRRGPFDAN